MLLSLLYPSPAYLMPILAWENMAGYCAEIIVRGLKLKNRGTKDLSRASVF